MNFCPACGASLNNNSKFCASCGQSLTEPVNQNNSNTIVMEAEEILPPLPRKKRVPVWVWVIGGIVMIAVVGMIYGALTYPKNEMQVENLLCDQYWKVDDVSVDEIYYDGKMVRKGKNIASTLENAFNGMDGDEVYKKFETDLKATWSHDNFIFFKKMNNGTYWQFSQWIDSKQQKDYIFSSDYYEMNRLSSHFELHNKNKTSNNYYVETGEVYDTFTIKEDKSEIVSLDKNELSVKNTLEMGSIKVVTRITYKKSPKLSHDTRQLDSYLSIFELGNGLNPPAETEAIAVDSASAY